MDEQGTKTREVPEKDPRDRHGLVGQTIDGRIKIEGVVGEGGMGIVYLGHQTNVDRKVAIKVLLPERCDEETVLRFKNEAKAASRLSHPNTITIHDFGNWGDLLYIVMEFLVGQAFQDVLDKKQPIEAVRVCKIATQVLASLHEAHQAGIIHRDIKPDNIFLKTVGGQSDFVKVLDFGVAKLNEQLRGGDATLTKAGMIFGTPKYMSPEQATAKGLDCRSDLYSVGVMMYEALTARAPFTATDPVSILIQHVHDDPPPFHEVAPGTEIPLELQQIVLRAMQKKPENRYASALVMKETIEQALIAMQANLATIQGSAVPGATTGSVAPAAYHTGAPPPAPSYPSGPGQPPPSYPSGPGQPPPTHPPGQVPPGTVPQVTQSGAWAEGLGVGHRSSGPTSGLGGTPPAPTVMTHQGGGKGLLMAVAIVGVLLLGAVGYLIVAQMGGAPADDDAGVAAGSDTGQAETPDAGGGQQVAAADTGSPPVESDAGQIAIVTTPDAAPSLEDAVANVDEPPVVETPDVEAVEDVVALVEEVVEAPSESLVRVRFSVEPEGARLSFRGRDYERDGGFYIFDRSEGDRLRVYASASHFLDKRVTADLSDANDDGVLRVRVRLELDPCDPANGPVDPYVCE